MSAAYAYLHGYAVGRGFAPLSPPASRAGAGTRSGRTRPASRWMDYVLDVVHAVDHRFATLADRRHRRALYHRFCLSLRPGGAYPIPFSCRRLRAEHGLPNT